MKILPCFVHQDYFLSSPWTFSKAAFSSPVRCFSVTSGSFPTASFISWLWLLFCSRGHEHHFASTLNLPMDHVVLSKKAVPWLDFSSFLIVQCLELLSSISLPAAAFAGNFGVAQGRAINISECPRPTSSKSSSPSILCLLLTVVEGLQMVVVPSWELSHLGF